MKPEVLGGLFGDGGDRGDRRAGVLQHDVLDVLRPDGGEPGNGARSDRGAGGLQQPAAGEMRIGVWLSCVSFWLLTFGADERLFLGTAVAYPGFAASHNFLLRQLVSNNR